MNVGGGFVEVPFEGGVLTLLHVEVGMTTEMNNVRGRFRTV